jgi:molecular chaperone DnaK (HSP70)
MPNKKVRRLFNIQTDEVSLVDVAANKRKFLVVKRKEESEKTVDLEPILKALEKVESAINTLATEVKKGNDLSDTLSKSLTLNADELKKVGAKFSKETLSHLKTLRDTLSKILDGTETEGDPTQKKQDKVEATAEEAASALQKGLTAALNPETKPADNLADTIAKVVGEVMKGLNIQK